MPGATLSPELCGRIVQFAAPRRHDLLSLCLVSKAFQKEAEIRLYASLAFGDPHSTHLACRTLLNSERLPSLVRSFWFNQEYPHRQQPPALPRPFWLHLQSALKRMPNLEFLVLCDHTFQNTWVLNCPEFPFQLREAKLRFSWDRNLVRFLEGQPKLKLLHMIDRSEDHVTEEINPACLSNLRIFEGTISVGHQFYSCPLTNVQFYIDQEPEAILPLLHKISQCNKTLRGLSILELPEKLTLPALDFISKSCMNLRHIGHLPLPIHNRPKFIYCLMRLQYLRSIELDVSNWSPVPIPIAQKALVTELKTFCPPLRFVVFWVGHTRIRWNYNGDTWNHRVDNNQYRPYSGLWVAA